MPCQIASDVDTLTSSAMGGRSGLVTGYGVVGNAKFFTFSGGDIVFKG